MQYLAEEVEQGRVTISDLQQSESHRSLARSLGREKNALQALDNPDPRRMQLFDQMETGATARVPKTRQLIAELLGEKGYSEDMEHFFNSMRTDLTRVSKVEAERRKRTRDQRSEGRG